MAPAPSDRRACKIIATTEGRRVLGRYEAAVAEFEADLFSGLEEPQGRTLANLIAHLAMDIHRAQPGANPCEAMDHLP